MRLHAGASLIQQDPLCVSELESKMDEFLRKVLLLAPWAW
eukprot:jgi/Mesvir1/13856/Mv25594-RA.1